MSVIVPLHHGSETMENGRSRRRDRINKSRCKPPFLSSHLLRRTPTRPLPRALPRRVPSHSFLDHHPPSRV